MAGPSAVCVYCGSSMGEDPRHAEAAAQLGSELALGGVRLVYGGGAWGLMGVVAQAAKAAGGHVTGVIPEFLFQREGRSLVLDDEIVVPDMHTRKRIMFEKSDAFVALPGGIGTVEELVEMLTWVQLGRHDKPILIANVAGFWNPLLDLFEHMRAGGFIRKAHARDLAYLVADEVADILPMLRRARGGSQTSGLTLEQL
jgi:uncharacterized protein (TIGR00730 family)